MRSSPILPSPRCKTSLFDHISIGPTPISTGHLLLTALMVIVDLIVISKFLELSAGDQHIHERCDKSKGSSKWLTVVSSCRFDCNSKE